MTTNARGFEGEIVRPVNRANYLLICGAMCFCIACALSITSAQKKPPSKPIELNSATIEQLEQLPGIGPGTAKAILRFREKSGPFERVEDLLAIRGISKARLEKLRPYITVSPPSKKSQ